MPMLTEKEGYEILEIQKCPRITIIMMKAHNPKINKRAVERTVCDAFEQYDKLMGEYHNRSWGFDVIWQD